jgi:hypothetical protein
MFGSRYVQAYLCLMWERELTEVPTDFSRQDGLRRHERGWRLLFCVLHIEHRFRVLGTWNGESICFLSLVLGSGWTGYVSVKYS